jgi:hypothetical protein
MLANNMDTYGVRAIHPRPERRGFSRIPVNVVHYLFPSVT